MLKVGVIGLGKMGLLHLQNSIIIDDVKVEAVADRSKRSLKVAKSYKITNLFSDFTDLITSMSDLDAVIISLPNWLHRDSVEIALEYGINVFIEKPLAITSSECKEISQMVKNSGRKLMVGHSMRFLDAVIKMKNLADKGIIGKLEAINIEEVMNGPFSHGAIPTPVADWWFNPEKSGGGALIDIGYHLIDLFHYFAGESKLIFSLLEHKFNLPVEDSGILILESLDTSIKGIINTGWYQQMIFPRFDFSLNVHGRAGYLSSVDFIPKNIYVHAIKEGIKNSVRKVTGKKIHPLSYTYFYESHYNELVHFYHCLKNDVEPSVTADDATRTIKIIEEAYKNT